MKRFTLLFLCVVPLVIGLFFACSAFNSFLSGTNVDTGYAVVMATSPVQGEQEDLALYVLTDQKGKHSRYSPSGWMVDTTSLRVSGAPVLDQPQLGKTCLRIRYDASGANGWVGVYWQNPANNWGTVSGGLDLNGKKALTFWARGENGGERISEVRIGGMRGAYSDTAKISAGPFILRKEWTKYSIDVKPYDLSRISGGFCFVLTRKGNPAGSTFYIDEIRYEQ
jgi:hypothetical protein